MTRKAHGAGVERQEMESMGDRQDWAPTAVGRGEQIGPVSGWYPSVAVRAAVYTWMPGVSGGILAHEDHDAVAGRRSPWECRL